MFFIKIFERGLLLLAVVGFLSCGRSSGPGPETRSNAPPVMTSVRILPDRPEGGSDLSVSVECKDPDGDPVTYEYRWFKNDQEISGEKTNILKIGSFRKGDLIQVRVTANDGKATTAPVFSQTVKIQNSPAVIEAAWIEPKVAYANDDLKAFCRAGDKDGDLIYYTYQWEKNGVVLSEDKADKLERGRFKKGDSIVAIITPDDRDVLGTPKKSDPAIISNSPPVITSSPPSRVEGSTYLYPVKARDPDDDPVTFVLKTGPQGMTIDKNSGLVRWDIRKENKGTHTVEIEASDSDGARSLQRYTLTVDFK